MKNSLNILLLTTGVLAIGLFITLEYLTRNKIAPILYDENIDKTELHLCDEDRIPQYYMVSTDYNGGKRAIKNQLLPTIKNKQTLFGSSNSNISIRFIVNCQGEIGLFRTKSIDLNLKNTTFNKESVKYLISLISQLDDWNIVPRKNKTFDSYYFINFKIRNGHVIDIF